MKRRDFIGSMAIGSATALVAGPAVAQTQETQAAETPARLKAIRFRVDVTPPLGERITYSLCEKPGSPIYVSGIVLDDGKTKAAWVSCDFIYICGEAVDVWKAAMARAIGCPAENVMLHSVHQHDAPRIRTHQYDAAVVSGKIAIASASQTYCDKSLGDICAAIKKGVAGPWTPIEHVYTAEQRIGGLGAARRLVDEKGVCVAVRWSRTKDEKVRAWPVGTIDTTFRTVCFEGPGGKKFVALHFYATHPMAAYLRKMVGPDVPGVAVQYAQKKTPDLMHIYFTGCAGNVTLGKYNLTGDQAAIDELGTRMGEAMLTNLELLQEKKVDSIRFARSTVDVPFDLARVKAVPDREYLLKTLDRWKKATMTRFSLGENLHMLSIGMGEVCVEYQLYAQSLVPDLFLATAAYVNGVYEYTPLAKAFPEGGYESSEAACNATPEIEVNLKKAIKAALLDLMK